MQFFKKFSGSLSLTAVLFFLSGILSAQTIQPHFFGVNAWMPDTIGNASNCQDPPCIKYGKLHSNWAKVADSEAQSVRYGGIAVDKNMPTNYQYIRMIDSIRAKGMEPIIQVPYWNGRYSAQQAAAIVQYVNGTRGRNIKYWVIGNEPDLKYSATSASQVAVYIKSFATAMKSADTSIRIIGPETAWFNKAILDGLTQPGGSYDITGKDANGRYYVDIISFHAYPMGTNQTTIPTRAQLIAKLSTGTSSFESNLAYLNGRLSSANSYHNRGARALRAAVTEANVVYMNNAADGLTGVGANSFIGGQFVAELYGIGLKYGLAFVNLWSAIEGSNMESNIGFIDRTTGNKKPLYHHFRMMAENLKGSYINSSDNQANIKTFSSKNGSVTTVMIMNQDAAVDHNYTIRLNTAAVSGTNTLKINADVGIATEYSDVLPNQSSIILQFDAAGSLTKKCVYSMTVQALANLAPSCTNYSTVDLAITSASATSSAANPGATLSLGATLSNLGSSKSATSSTGYFLSADSVLSTGDIYLGASASPTLNGGSSSSLQTAVTVPTTVTAGNYFLLFVADRNNAVSESNENNNVRKLPITIQQPANIDLVMLGPAGTPTVVLAGGTVSLSSTIFNQGTTVSPGGKIGYYISSDTLLDAGDGFLAYSSPATLTPSGGAVKTKTVAIAGSKPAGFYYILLKADYALEIAESNEQNNLAHVKIQVIKPASIDLLVTSASLSQATIAPGATVTASANVVNSGSLGAASAEMGYYISSDAVLSSGDLLLASTGTFSLPGGQSVLKQHALLIPQNLAPGNYHLLFAADPANVELESNETNNVSTVTLAVQQLSADLTLVSAAASATQVVAGSALALTALVQNIGLNTANGGKTGYYLSTDTLVDSGDSFLGFSPGSTLTTGSSAQLQFTVTIPSTSSAGNYFVLFYADYAAELSESNEANNLRYAAVAVKTQVLQQADLVVNQASASALNVTAGSKVSLACNIKNMGATGASLSKVGYYLSVDTVFDAGDNYLGMSSGGYLAGGSSSPRSYVFKLHVNQQPGNYYLLFVADPFTEVSEASEQNNAAHVALNIYSRKQDLPPASVSDTSANALLTGIDAGRALDVTNVYPNPTSGRITLQLSGTAEGRDGRVELLDVNGRIVYVRDLSFSASQEIGFPEDLRSGVYFLRVQQGEAFVIKNIVIAR